MSQHTTPVEEHAMSTNTNRDENTSKLQLTNSTCIVTGGAGFIGSHLTETLANPQLNNHVIVIDNLITGCLHNISELLDIDNQNIANINKKLEIFDRAQANPNKIQEEQKQDATIIRQDKYLPDNTQLSGDHVTFIKADIRNRALLQKLFQKYKPNYVFHLAAIASVPKSIGDPTTTHDVNVTGTFNLLNASRELPKDYIKKFVFSSSCSVYGNPPENELPIKETKPPDPLSPYATSKLMGEEYCQIFSKTYDLPTVCLRYFNVYGPRQDPNGDYAAVIPKFIECIKQGKPLTVYGDGAQTRDFIFVDDVVNANIALATADNADGFDIVNVGTGEQISIHFLANTLLSIHGKDLEFIEYKPERSGDIHDSFADNEKLEHVLQRNGFEVPLDLTNGLIDTAKIDETEVLIL